ncbi:MAG: energy transducer TonB [Thermomonas sp.]
MFSAICFAALCASPLIVFAAEPGSKVVAFSASVRVDVDAVGKPVKIEAPGDLPEAIREYIEKRVATWQYEPARLGKVAVPATTYVAINACAVPVEDGYRMGLDFAGNGMRSAGDRPINSPRYPVQAEMHGIEAEFVVILDVAADGAARLGTIEKATVARRGRRVEFEQELRRWAMSLRFDPELVSGQPVSGQLRVPVNFSLKNYANVQALTDDFQAKAKDSPECQVAAGADAIKPVAMDSVIRVIPSPAG